MEGQFSHVHLFLFRCAECAEPLLIAATSNGENTGETENAAYDVLCTCGWLKRFLGLEAIGHYVVPWIDAPSENHLPDRTVDDSGLAET